MTKVLTNYLSYFYYQSEWDPRDDWKNNGYEVEGDATDVRQNRVYMQTSFRFTKDLEGYMRIGGADVKVQDALDGGESGFSGSNQFFTSLGIKVLIEPVAQFLNRVM